MSSGQISRYTKSAVVLSTPVARLGEDGSARLNSVSRGRRETQEVVGIIERRRLSHTKTDKLQNRTLFARNFHNEDVVLRKPTIIS